MPERHTTSRTAGGACPRVRSEQNRKRELMANKYSKSNKSSKAAEEKTMQDYEERRKKLNRGARIMALILVASMIVFYVISAGLFLFN